jgi:hypothetical protein
MRREYALAQSVTRLQTTVEELERVVAVLGAGRTHVRGGARDARCRGRDLAAAIGALILAA